jgi:hypothetical protein
MVQIGRAAVRLPSVRSGAVLAWPARSCAVVVDVVCKEAEVVLHVKNHTATPGAAPAVSPVPVVRCRQRAMARALSPEMSVEPKEEEASPPPLPAAVLRVDITDSSDGDRVLRRDEAKQFGEVCGLLAGRARLEAVADGGEQLLLHALKVRRRRALCAERPAMSS